MRRIPLLEEGTATWELFQQMRPVSGETEMSRSGWPQNLPKATMPDK